MGSMTASFSGSSRTRERTALSTLTRRADCRFAGQHRRGSRHDPLEDFLGVHAVHGRFRHRIGCRNFTNFPAFFSGLLSSTFGLRL